MSADVVKVRLMNDKKHEFKGAFDCIRQVLAREGPFGFYKGFGMCWARVSPSSVLRVHRDSDMCFQLGTHTILTFLIFERVRYWFGIEAM